MAMISILIVDDEVQFLEMTRMFLEKGRGIRAYTATSGVMALEMLKERKYDAIISDYAMPGMNGIEFMKQVRAMGDDTPFIIFTGKGREDVVIDALNFGADLYMQKDADPRSQFGEIMSRIKQIVSTKALTTDERNQFSRYASLLECFPGMAYYSLINQEERTVYISNGAFSLTGYAPTDFLGDGKISSRELIHPDYLQVVEAELEKSIADNRPFRIIYPIITASGEEKTVLETGHGIYDEQGSVQAIGGFIIEFKR